MSETIREYLRRNFLGLLAISLAALAVGACLPIAKAEARDRVGKIVERAGAPVPTTDVGVATCRSGERRVGGGALGEGENLLRISAPDWNSSTRWLTYAYNEGATGNLTAYAYCAQPARRDRVGKIVERAGLPVSVPPGQSRDAFASCRSGERRVGGGAEGQGTTQGNLLQISAPDPNSPNRWFTRAYNDSTEFVYTLTAYAYCAKPASRDRVGKIVERAGLPVSVPPGQSRDAFASCRSGERRVGGGARGQGRNRIRISAPDPNSPSRWFTRAYNIDSNLSTDLTAYAYCAKPAHRSRGRS